MKLVKIFANRNFKNVEFNSSFNVVLAEISNLKDKKDTHNLGKTSLIHVINFILLGGFNKKIFGNKIFKGMVFCGEIELNNGNYLIVKRAIENNTKISFKISKTKNQGFEIPNDWDEENVAFEKSREKLNAYLDFGVVTNYDYRKSITYFLRTQQDFLDVYKLDKFQGKHIDWKPFVFELLGFDGNLIIQKLTLEDEIKAKQEVITTLKQEANINIEERDKLLGLLDIKKEEFELNQSNIDKFNFFEQDKSINKELIEDLDYKIQALNTERYRITYEISKIEDSLSKIVEDINLDTLKKLHNEVSLFFPNELIREFADLINFNESITKDRRKYLAENLKELKSEFTIIDRDIKITELEKSDKLTFLTERDSYSKFKKYQSEITKVSVEIERINDKLEAIDKSVKIEGEISDIKNDVDKAIHKISNAINLRNHAEINRIFNSIISDVLGTNALISIKQNKQGNVDFGADYQNPADLISTSESQGTTYKKILCMAFDLSLLIHYSKKSFFRFVYHDGILEGLDNRIKIRLLDKIKEICNEYGIQYILSIIDSDIPTDTKGDSYIFEETEICLKLNDKDDNGKLFLHSY